jgi:hypothetical protein
MTQPFLVGKRLEVLAQRASEDWVKSLGDRLGADTTPVSLEILNGGHYYFCADAYKAATGRDCAVATLRAKRGHDSAETYGGDAHHATDVPEGTTLWKSEGSDWCVRIWEHSPLPPGPLLVGDTVATGTTLAGVLEFCVHEMGKTNSYQDIHVFSIVGASSWQDVDGADGGIAVKLAPLDKILQEHGRELTVTFANARFALQPNGTDLSFVGADMLPEASEAVEAKLGTVSRHPLSVRPAPPQRYSFVSPTRICKAGICCRRY